MLAQFLTVHSTLHCQDSTVELVLTEEVWRSWPQCMSVGKLTYHHLSVMGVVWEQK